MYNKKPIVAEIKSGSQFWLLEATDGSSWFGALGAKNGVYLYDDGKIILHHFLPLHNFTCDECSLHLKKVNLLGILAFIMKTNYQALILEDDPIIIEQLAAFLEQTNLFDQLLICSSTMQVISILHAFLRKS